MGIEACWILTVMVGENVGKSERRETEQSNNGAPAERPRPHTQRDQERERERERSSGGRKILTMWLSECSGGVVVAKRRE